MSQEARLERLGLLHLKDNPDALMAELERRILQHPNPPRNLYPAGSPSQARWEPKWEAEMQRRAKAPQSYQGSLYE
jgi:hypothetical protein